MAAVIRVAMIDDDPLALHSQQNLLRPMPDLTVVYSGTGVGPYLGSGVVADVVVLDLLLRDGRPPAEHVARLAGTGAAVLVTSNRRDNHPEVRATVRAGASGYLTKNPDGPRLADAIRTVHDGNTVFTPELAFIVSLTPPELTDRQIDIAREFARGRTYEAIARKHGISVSGVRSHLNTIYEMFARAGDPMDLKTGDPGHNRSELGQRLPRRRRP